jgi:hypothetical protein
VAVLCQPGCAWLQLYPEAGVVVITDRTEGFGVASGVRGAREIACAWAGMAGTTLPLIIKMGACLGLAGSFYNTLQISCASS